MAKFMVVLFEEMATANPAFSDHHLGHSAATNNEPKDYDSLKA